MILPVSSYRLRSPSRRHALLVFAAGSVAAACTPGDDDSAAGEATPAGPEPLYFGPIDVGALGEFQPGSLRIAGAAGVVVGRDGAGLWAVSMACTHLACDIGDGGEIDWQGIRCPCHGSRYDRDGRVVEGPAVRDLRNHPVSFDGERVIVDTSLRVDPGTRTPA
jgi:Rieske Fe-S protein